MGGSARPAPPGGGDTTHRHRGGGRGEPAAGRGGGGAAALHLPHRGGTHTDTDPHRGPDAPPPPPRRTGVRAPAGDTPPLPFAPARGGAARCPQPGRGRPGPAAPAAPAAAAAAGGDGPAGATAPAGPTPTPAPAPAPAPAQLRGLRGETGAAGPGLPEGLGRAAGAHARLLRGAPGLRAPGGAGPGRAGGRTGQGQEPRPQAAGTGGDTEGGEPGGAGDVAGFHPDHGGDEGAHRPGAAARPLLPALGGPARGAGPQGHPWVPRHPQPPRATTAPGRAVPRVPSCFFEVTRVEAERLLERSTGGGNMVLRPGGHGPGVSVTTRQEMNGTVLLKHYKVSRVDQGYVIDVDTPHRCSSLAEVVQYFVESSKGSLRPLHREYSPRLEFVETDGENGEETQGVCEPPLAAPTPQPQGLSALKPSPSPHRSALQPPGRPGGPPPFGAIPEEHTYMNEQGNRDPQSSAPRPAPRRALLPPHDHGMVEELTKKLQLRQALIED